MCGYLSTIQESLPPEKQSVSNKRFTVVSPIQEYPSSPLLGICIISVEHNDLEKLLSVPTSSNFSSICLSNEKNTPIITIGSKDAIDYFLKNHSMSKLYGSFSGKFDNSNYLINYKNLSTSSWKVIEIIPNNVP